MIRISQTGNNKDRENKKGWALLHLYCTEFYKRILLLLMKWLMGSKGTLITLAKSYWNMIWWEEIPLFFPQENGTR